MLYGDEDYLELSQVAGPVVINKIVVEVIICMSRI